MHVIMHTICALTFFTTFSFSGALSKRASKASLSENKNKLNIINDFYRRYNITVLASIEFQK